MHLKRRTGSGPKNSSSATTNQSQIIYPPPQLNNDKYVVLIPDQQMYSLLSDFGEGNRIELNSSTDSITSTSTNEYALSLPCFKHLFIYLDVSVEEVKRTIIRRISHRKLFNNNNKQNASNNIEANEYCICIPPSYNPTDNQNQTIWMDDRKLFSNYTKFLKCVST